MKLLNPTKEVSAGVCKNRCERINTVCVCVCLQKDVKDVFTAISFEVAYSLGPHMLDPDPNPDLPPLTPVLRWRKGDKMAAHNKVRSWL